MFLYIGQIKNRSIHRTVRIITILNCTDEECLGFLDQRKWAKLQWIQDPRQSNVDILNNVRREVSRHFRNKKKAYLRDKIEELETNNKIQILGTYIGASITLRRGTSLDVI